MMGVRIVFGCLDPRRSCVMVDPVETCVIVGPADSCVIVGPVDSCVMVDSVDSCALVDPAHSCVMVLGVPSCKRLGAVTFFFFARPLLFLERVEGVGVRGQDQRRRRAFSKQVLFCLT